MKGDRVFNTGRVLIGAAYQPRRPAPEMSADMERLQRALLAPPRRPGVVMRALRALFRSNRHA